MDRRSELEHKLIDKKITESELEELEEMTKKDFEFMRKESLKEAERIKELEDEETKVLEKAIEESKQLEITRQKSIEEEIKSQNSNENDDWAEDPSEEVKEKPIEEMRPAEEETKEEPVEVQKKEDVKLAPLK